MARRKRRPLPPSKGLLSETCYCDRVELGLPHNHTLGEHKHKTGHLPGTMVYRLGHPAIRLP